MKRMAKSSISFLLCLSVLLSAFAYRPQKAKAVALTSTAVVASVAAVMTACGVTYWANTQQDAISYLGGKIDDYLDTISQNTITYDEWLDVNGVTSLFNVVGNGVVSFGNSVANKILDFVTWFNQEEGIVSNGSNVGNGGLATLQQSIRGDFTGDVHYENLGTAVKLVVNNFRQNNTSGKYFNVLIPVTQGQSINITITDISGITYLGSWNAIASDGSNLSTYSGDGNSFMKDHYINITSNKDYVLLGAYMGNISGEKTGYIVFTISSSELVTENTVLITPSQSVLVPPALEESQNLVVTTNAPIQQDDTQEEACQAILDTVVSQDGLDATNATEGETVPSAWTWLYNVVRGLADTVENILDVIRGIPAAIAQAIAGLFIPDRTYLETYVASLTSVFEGRVGILTFPLTLVYQFLGRFAQLADGDSDHVLRWGNINEPFSGRQIIAAGSYDLDDAVSGSTAMTNAYSIYMVVVRAMIVLWFAELCRKKYEKVMAR